MRGRVGLGSRIGIGLQVAIGAVAALVVVLLVNWLAGRPGVRQRFDLTATGKNTLSTATLGLLERMPEGVTIEILYRPAEPPLTDVAADVMLRTQKLLAVLEIEAGGKLDVEHVDLQDREAWRERAFELRMSGFENGLVVSRGDNRTFLSLVGDLATFDIGHPTAEGFVPPRVTAFTAEEAIVEALLDVTRGERRHAYFTFGFGELDALDEEGDQGMGLLAAALERDGFRVHRWNSLEDGPLPDDCAVLAIVAPKSPFPDEMRERIEAYVDGGGRLVIAPATQSDDLVRSDVPALLERWGIGVGEGRVMRYAVDTNTGAVYDGVLECEAHWITPNQMAAHELLRPFRDANRSFLLTGVHPVRVVRQPEEGVSVAIVQSGPNAWLDAPPCDRVRDPDVEIDLRRHDLVVVSRFAPPEPPPTPPGLEAQPETKIVAIGSEIAFGNGMNPRNEDVLRSVFNWVTDQDHRVTVSPRDPDLRFLPRDDPEAAVTVTRVAQFGLPGLCVLAWLVTLFVRARGGPRRAAA